MKTFNFSLCLEEIQLMQVQEGFEGSEVHMGESKVLERSTKGSLFDLVISDGDLHVTEG